MTKQISDLKTLPTPASTLLVQQYVADLFVAAGAEARHRRAASKVVAEHVDSGCGILRSRASDRAVCISATGTRKPTA